MKRPLPDTMSKEPTARSRPGPARPLVSIIVLYYKRREIIEQTLASVLAQDYREREIILVDNHSEDDLARIVQKLGPEITLIQLEENIGACGGRNVGIRAARGNIFVFVDDDVCFAGPSEITKIVEAFAERPDMHGLALQICDPASGKVRIREWCHTRPYDTWVEREFETNFFGEGASAFRRQVFDECGLYYEPLYYGGEGHDMVLRILDRGFRLLHTPGIRVHHWASETGRSAERQYYFFTRNFIWMACKDYTWWPGLRFVIPKIAMMLYFALRTSSYGPVLRGIVDGIRGLRAVHGHRTPISRATIRYMADQEKWRPGILTRLARHRSQPQI